MMFKRESMMVEIRQTIYMITTSLAGLERESRVLLTRYQIKLKVRMVPCKEHSFGIILFIFRKEVKKW